MRQHIRERLTGLLVRPRSWFAWFVLVVVTTAMFLIVVPGERVFMTGFNVGPPKLLPDRLGNVGKDGLRVRRGASYPMIVHEYEHGWPFAFARRAIGFGGKNWPKEGTSTKPRWSYPGKVGIAWSVPDAWPFSSDVSEWRVVALLTDCVIVAAIAIFAATMTERWIQRRKRLWRLRLFDLMALTTVVALFFGWRQWHLQQHRLEYELLVSMQEARNSHFSAAVPNFNSPMLSGDVVDTTPAWLRRLLGTSEFTSWCRHLQSPPGWLLSKISEKSWGLLSQLKYIESADLRAEPSAEVLSKVSKIRPLRELNIQLYRGDANFDEVLIDLSPLASMPKLETLEIMCPYLLVDDLLPLLESRSLREVKLEEASIMRSELDTFEQQHVPRFTVSHKHNVTPWGVVYVQLARWMAEDRINYSQLSRLSVGTINLTGFDLTTDRLKRLEPVCDEISELTFGEGANLEGVLTFVLACPKLETLRLGDRLTSDEDLIALLRLRHLRMLAFRQANTSQECLARLVELPNLAELQISGMSLSHDEAADLRRKLMADDRSIHLEAVRD